MSTITEPNSNREEIEISKLVAEVKNLLADTLKTEDEREELRAEARKMWTEARWYPLWVGAAIFEAGAALAKLFM